MSRNDFIDYVNENTFKNKLSKLYKLVIGEARIHNIDIKDFTFVNCEGFNEVIDVNYTNHIKDFSVCAKGSEKRGYRILDSILDDTLTDEDLE